MDSVLNEAECGSTIAIIGRDVPKERRSSLPILIRKNCPQSEQVVNSGQQLAKSNPKQAMLERAFAPQGFPKISSAIAKSDPHLEATCSRS